MAWFFVLWKTKQRLSFEMKWRSRVQARGFVFATLSSRAVQCKSCGGHIKRKVHHFSDGFFVLRRTWSYASEIWSKMKINYDSNWTFYLQEWIYSGPWNNPLWKYRVLLFLKVWKAQSFCKLKLNSSGDSKDHRRLSGITTSLERFFVGTIFKSEPCLPAGRFVNIRSLSNYWDA